MRVVWCMVALVTLSAAGADSADSADSADVCEAPRLWADLLEAWAATPDAPPGRHGRVMSLPPTKGYYVTDRVDLVPPPPPRPYGPHTGPHTGSHAGPHTVPLTGPHAATHTGPHAGPSAQAQYSQYDEWQVTPPGAGKIVNRPPNPYKDQFKPSYGAAGHGQPIPLGAADRVDAAPAKQVSETDLYLLSAIEKLVYRADLMEKRLRRLETSVHLLVAGRDPAPEPCARNWTQVAGACYLVSAEAGDWKAASLRCRRAHAHLLELHSDDKKTKLFAGLLADHNLKGSEFWTGGLNPGLLWIWAHSARPLAGNATGGAPGTGPDGAPGAPGTGPGAASVVGGGRCLALVHDPALATYAYRGHDCGQRHRYICEATEDKMKLSNEIERVARQLKGFTRSAKLLAIR